MLMVVLVVLILWFVFGNTWWTELSLWGVWLVCLRWPQPFNQPVVQLFTLVYSSNTLFSPLNIIYIYNIYLFVIFMILYIYI